MIAGADGEIAGLVEQRAVVVDGPDRMPEPLALAFEGAPVVLEVETHGH
jgi:hypothetical protein